MFAFDAERNPDTVPSDSGIALRLPSEKTQQPSWADQKPPMKSLPKNPLLTCGIVRGTCNFIHHVAEVMATGRRHRTAVVFLGVKATENVPRRSNTMKGNHENG
jgi:hypothetical protein